MSDLQAGKASWRSVVDRIEVDDQPIRIIDDSSVLTARLSGLYSFAGNVRGLETKWRAFPNKTANLYVLEFAPWRR